MLAGVVGGDGGAGAGAGAGVRQHWTLRPLLIPALRFFHVAVQNVMVIVMAMVVVQGEYKRAS